MIDTDKYEGHDMHRIIIDKSGANHSYVIYTNKHGGKDSMYVNDTTAELIADAPLLLEEVKRLREGLRRLLNPYQHGLSNDKEPLPKWLGDAVRELIE